VVVALLLLLLRVVVVVLLLLLVVPQLQLLLLLLRVLRLTKPCLCMVLALVLGTHYVRQVLGSSTTCRGFL